MDQLFTNATDLSNLIISRYCTYSSIFCMRFVNKACNKIAREMLVDDVRNSFMYLDSVEYYLFYVGLCSDGYKTLPNRYALVNALELFKWAIGNGYEWNEYTYWCAKTNECWRICEYLKENGYPEKWMDDYEN